MKLNTLVGVALASFVCTTSFAMDIYKGRVISETQNLAGNPRAIFKDIKIDLKNTLSPKAYAKKHIPETTEAIGIHVNLWPSYTDVNPGSEDERLKGNFDVSISNNSGKTKVYKIETEMYMMGKDINEDDVPYVVNTYMVSLESGGHIYMDRSINYPFKAPVNEGTYTGVLDTFVTIEGESTLFYSGKEASINVFNNAEKK